MLNKLRSHFLPLLLLIVISMVSHLAWLNPNLILTNGDVWFLYREGMLTSNWGTWSSVLSFGDLNVSYNLFLLTSVWQLFSKLSLNYQMANQFVYFFPIIFLTPIAIYSYLFYLTKKIIPSLIGSFVYLFTTIFLLLQLGGLLQATAYSLLPLVFLYFEKYIKEKRTMDGLFFSLLLSISILYELRISYITIIILFFYLIFLLYDQYRRAFGKQLLQIIKKSIPFFILLILLNAYIYLPLVANSSIQESAGQVTGRSLFGVQFFTLKEPLVLMHPFWTGKEPSEFISQPIPFYFWLFPLYAFGALFFVKKNSKIVFFASVALLMVFLGKSAADPLGWIYTWLYYNFPGFSFFREPSKFWLMLSFAYTVLITFTVLYGIELINQLSRKLNQKRVLQSLYVIPLVIVVMLVAKPAFTGELGRLLKPINVPQDHFYLKDFLSKQTDIFRTYYIPGRYRLGFWSEIHPMLGLHEISQNFQSLEPYILSLLGVKYVILPPDITNDVYRHWGDKKVFTEAVNEAEGLKKLNDPQFGDFSVYENTLPFKPRIYPSSETMYVVGGQGQIKNLLPFTHSQNTTIYFENNNSSPKEEVQNIINKEKEVNYNQSDGSFIIPSCIRCESRNYREGLVYPFARFLPNSFVYPFIVSRENKQINSLNEVPARFRVLVFLATKRIIEVQQLTDRNINQESIFIALKGHRDILNQMEANMNYFDKNTLDNDSLLYIRDYLDIQRDIANTYLTNNTLNGKNVSLLKENYVQLIPLLQKFDGLIWFGDKINNRYFVDIPKDGVYEVFVKGDIESFQIQIGDNIYTLEESNKKGWLTTHEKFFPKGVYKMVIKDDKLVVNEQRLELTLEPSKKEKEIEILIPQIEENVEYIVSFNYKATKNTQVHYLIDRDSDFNQNGIVRKTSEKFLIADDQWHEEGNNRFTARFGEKVDKIKFGITNVNDATSSLIIEHLEVVKNVSPLVGFKEINKVPTNNSLPKITFQWINPTKYRVHVSDAKKPFNLILSESYHPGWQAFYTPEKEKLQGIVAATHEDGNVIELKGENNLDLLSFTALFTNDDQKIPIHWSVNGYANAWYIDKTGDFYIDIEFTPQRIFTLGIAISSVGLIIVIIWLMVLFIKKFKRS